MHLNSDICKQEVGEIEEPCDESEPQDDADELEADEYGTTGSEEDELLQRKITMTKNISMDQKRTCRRRIARNFRQTS